MNRAIIVLFVATFACFYFIDQVGSASVKKNPLWSLPGKCPVDHSVGICVVLPGACYSDDECVEKFGELYKCCPSGCNRFCKKVF
ncbi:hypothetical protein ABFA07_017376 [Porites harrisoni]